ncbi:uncharacterized protein LOC127584405 isoform X2 [Pristis pectinata]|uniref:uncharacterized protein LOC127584405 isoform X2 n=1 Tax=Pristis pectinata TaxID=685728 RepID=UPI00223CE497|nr:uncharacterized protein LOC127584405 isoform X2 [Pristis pectinata]
MSGDAIGSSTVGSGLSPCCCRPVRDSSTVPTTDVKLTGPQFPVFCLPPLSNNGVTSEVLQPTGTFLEHTDRRGKLISGRQFGEPAKSPRRGFGSGVSDRRG